MQYQPEYLLMPIRLKLTMFAKNKKRMKARDSQESQERMSENQTSLPQEAAEAGPSRATIARSPATPRNH